MSRTGKLRAVVAVWVAALALSLIGPGWAAQAAPTPIQPRPPSAVTADRLPTVQINGVVWSQVVVGNTVYAGGSFTQARPAGAAPGTNQTPRSNLLSYDITTGNLNTSFAPSLNGQVRSVTASPDGSRIYVVGDFTTANGQSRQRIAAYSTDTGALITTFNPVGVTATARAVVATDTAVYVGGGFAGAGGTLRNNLAAFSASTGALLPWNPNADYSVWALALSSDRTAVFAGGSFQNVGGQPAYGLAKISAATGALDTGWQLARVTSPPSPRNAGQDAGWTSLRVVGDYLYGTGWVFGNGGNLEGIFKASVANPGTLQWVVDCHGDSYSTFVSDGIVYGSSHSHYCGNMGDGAPQFEQWRYQYALAWNDTQTGDILNDPLNYTNWHGRQGPALVDWNPDFALGTYTGQYQAAWNIAGNADYVVYGGEFPSVNGAGQQGLVRFAKKPIAPGREGPRFVNGTLIPTLVPVSATALRVSWPAGFDRDDYTLTYRITRNGTTVKTTTANSNWWTLPAQGFIDTGVSPGQSYTYQVIVNDPDGNTVWGAPTSVTMPGSFPTATSYAALVRSLGARIYWPLNEKSGTVAIDRAAGPTSPDNTGVTDGRADTGVTWNQPGAIVGDSAASLGDNDFSRIYTGNCPSTASCSLSTTSAPDTFTAQVWVKTTTTRGGRILGFGDLQNGTSDHRDRQIYMDNQGHLIFGVRDESGVARTVASAATYRDNVWHLVTATMSPQGMVLYVDGASVAQRATTTRGERYLGYWRLGGDALGGWPSAPSTPNFIGSVDEVAVYPTALTLSNVQALYAARNGGGGGQNQPPAGGVHFEHDRSHGSVQRGILHRPGRFHRLLCVGLRRRRHGLGVDHDARLREPRNVLGDADGHRQRGSHRHRDPAGHSGRGIRHRRRCVQPHGEQRVGNSRHRRCVGAERLAGGLRRRGRGGNASDGSRIRTVGVARFGERDRLRDARELRLRQAGQRRRHLHLLRRPPRRDVRLPGQAAGHRDGNVAHARPDRERRRDHSRDTVDPRARVRARGCLERPIPRGGNGDHDPAGPRLGRRHDRAYDVDDGDGFHGGAAIGRCRRDLQLPVRVGEQCAHHAQCARPAGERALTRSGARRRSGGLRS
ncbi:hypothetical protein G5T42_16985 [Microbacterium sp. 4R-513]|uniref:LamG-like jellyroll fold domain-containing protein n=1 Tax=Microbacterium sp. 4R-513 TaxID=2567934 RepID=UPI0013E190AD|nr:LamG-like jellyroll fold domain-containing protein [Microbacterium sp. 4R-513]QIG40956.1 hypothetical protein G5T42_16985 [Microbacterium sp. 4R-513]